MTSMAGRTATDVVASGGKGNTVTSEIGTDRVRVLRRWLWAGGLVALALVIWMSLSSVQKPHAVFDYEVYDTVADLAAVSDAVVSGRVVGVAGRFDDRGGDPEFDEDGEAIPGVPMIVYRFEIGTVIQGDLDAQTILVGSVDLKRVTTDGVTPLTTGAEVVLFLDQVTADQAPDIVSIADELWVPVSGDVGVFDVEGEYLRPRAPDAVTRLTPETGPQERFSLADLRAVLATTD
jgi:hypothetical protein